MSLYLFLSMVFGLVVGFSGGFILGFIYCKYYVKKVKPEIQKSETVPTADNFIIDCDADPFVPDGLEVVEHHKGGKFQFTPSVVSLYLSEQQKNSNYISGEKLREELKNKTVLNANVLDWLIAHPHYIPEEWKNKFILFWGTIYRDSYGDLYVRCLYWRGGRWHWNHLQVDNDFYSYYPAALRASA